MGTSLVEPYHATSDVSDERAVWLAVLGQAFTDAKKPIDIYDKSIYCVKAARDYLVKSNVGLAEVCTLAGLEMDWVIKQAQAVEAAGWCSEAEQAYADANGKMKRYKAILKDEKGALLDDERKMLEYHFGLADRDAKLKFEIVKKEREKNETL